MAWARGNQSPEREVVILADPLLLPKLNMAWRAVVTHVQLDEVLGIALV